MKAIGVAAREDFAAAEPYASVADFLLIDAKPPQDAALPAMGAAPREAHVAPAADDVDFADDALTDEITVGTGDDVGDKFVTEDAPELHVAVSDFQIGGADAGLADFQERVAGGRGGIGPARVEAQRFVED